MSETCCDSYLFGAEGGTLVMEFGIKIELWDGKKKKNRTFQVKLEQKRSGKVVVAPSS